MTLNWRWKVEKYVKHFELFSEYKRCKFRNYLTSCRISACYKRPFNRKSTFRILIEAMMSFTGYRKVFKVKSVLSYFHFLFLRVSCNLYNNFKKVACKMGKWEAKISDVQLDAVVKHSANLANTYFDIYRPLSVFFFTLSQLLKIFLFVWCVSNNDTFEDIVLLPFLSNSFHYASVSIEIQLKAGHYA